MATDYVLFVHGVKQRQPDEFNRTTQTLLEGVKRAIGSNGRTIKPIVVFWGDLNVQPQTTLRQGLEASPQWRNLWLSDFRVNEVLEFAGDAALYLSRHVGAQVVQRFQQMALPALQAAQPGDRLHLVASVIVSATYGHLQDSSFELNVLKPCPAWMTPY
jgi:hypothetical protein